VSRIPTHNPLKIRDWSRGEEVASSLSHAAGFLAAVIGAPFLIAAAVHHGGVRPLLGVSLFAASAMLLYFCSALHHWLPAGRAKDVTELFDHAAIYLLIAGTQTPFDIGVLWGPWGWLLLGLTWSLAIFGISLKFLRGLQPPLLTVSIYVGMGLLILIASRPLAASVSMPGLWLLIGGGAAYIGGLIFYFARRFSYHHLAWHLSVVLGTTLHYFAVLKYSF
jgi:hemolysin III